MAAFAVIPADKVTWNYEEGENGLFSASGAVVLTVAGDSKALPGTENGSAKVTPLEMYPTKGRGTGGVRSQRFLKGQDTLVLAFVGAYPVHASTQGGAGVDQAAARLTAIDPDYLSMFKGVTLLGWISAMAWGLGYFGQPHIIVRFMAVRSVKDVPTARRIGMSWMIVSLIGAIAVGIFGRAYAERTGLQVTDPETIFIILSDLLFHPLVTGFLYAALLAAIMSTVSSQLLVTSSRTMRSRWLISSAARLCSAAAVAIWLFMALMVCTDPSMA